jgi:hypothetical protein
MKNDSSKKIQDLTVTIAVDNTPEEAFAAINDVRGWWTGDIEGPTGELGGEFTYRYQTFHYSKQKVTELVPGKRVVWLVVDSRLEFVADKDEWTGTRMIFDIALKGGKTEITFTHAGLVPTQECYGACSKAWGSLVGDKLRALISAGKGAPNGEKETRTSIKGPARARA